MAPSSRDRPMSSCARCYLMKKKCDKKVPSCSRCTQAGAPCLGISRSDKKELPRSAVQYLESRLAEIHQDSSLPSQSDERRNQSGVELSDKEAVPEDGYRHVLSTAYLAFRSICTSSVLRNNSGIHYDAKLFYASERPPLKIPVKGIYNEEPPRMASRGATFRLPALPAMVARGIPFQVAEKLFNNYLNNILPGYPCFLQSDLVEQFYLFYRDVNDAGQTLSEPTCFFVSMVLAISSLTSKAHDFWKVASLSESLQRDAIRHSSFLERADFRALQGLLLLIQMALLLPYTANLWYLSGEAMRLAISLGLHQEDLGQPKLNARDINLRRSVFWSVYYLERTIAIASGCPVAISDEHITTQTPSDSNSLEPTTEGQHHSREGLFLSHVRLSRIQSEIHGVQFFDQNLPADTPDYGDWIRKVENSVQEWQDSLSSVGDIPGWSLNAADHCRLLLYRPCSRNIVPSESGLQAATSVSISTIHGYWALVQGGNLVFSFQYVFNVFQAGMVLLYALGNHGAVELGFSLQEAANEAVNLLVPLFDALSAWWPAATDTSHYVKELKDIIQGSITTANIDTRSAYDVNLLAELDFMVTQRRIRSVYHRNVEIVKNPDQMMSWELSPWAHADSLTPLQEDLWQEIFTTGFEFLAESTPALPETEIATDWTSRCEPEQTPRNDVDSNTSVDIDLLVQSVPACSFCRTQHIKCDRSFPSCSACVKTNRACVFYDAVLEKTVLRSHVYDLYKRLHSPAEHDYTKPSLHETYVAEPRLECRPSQGVLIPFPETEAGDARSNSYLNPLTESAHTTQLNNWYFGPASAFASLTNIASIALGSMPPSQSFEPCKLQGTQTSALTYPTPPLPPPHITSALFNLFSRSVNVFYPTITEHKLHELIAAASDNDQEVSIPEQDQDIIFLILAIASQLKRNTKSSPFFSPQCYFQKATYHPNRTRDTWLRIDQLFLLQRHILICIYLLLDPAAGDIWRNLGFAIRSYFDLAHRPSANDDGKTQELMCMLFRTLYCLESQVSIAFGRPSLLVIGDKLRSEMTTPISGTISERVSVYFYRISLLKMQILSAILSAASRSASSPHRVGVAKERKDNPNHDHQQYERELDTWLADWKRDMETEDNNHVTTSNTTSHCAPVLEAWAELNYHHTAQLLHHLTSSPTTTTTISSADSAPSSINQHCNQITRSCTFLLRHQQKALLSLNNAASNIPIFPISWPTAHVIFSSGLLLSTLTTQRHEERESRGIAMTSANGSRKEMDGSMRRCITLLALLEGDASMLSTGFSEVLERVWYGEGDGMG